MTGELVEREFLGGPLDGERRTVDHLVRSVVIPGTSGDGVYTLATERKSGERFAFEWQGTR